MSPLKVFANPQALARGWYWALPARELRRGDKRELSIFGHALVLYRGQSGQVHCIDAYCSHMGAHLKEGRVEGEDLRCAFHGWKFTGTGRCAQIPCSSAQRKPEDIAPRKSFLVAERYGMIWLHSDPMATLSSDPLPEFKALQGREVVVEVDTQETRNCHPTLILGGGVDEEHFLFVHGGTTRNTGPLEFRFEELSPAVIRFWNQAPISGKSLKARILSWVYRGVLKYEVTYWHASTALAELGPPILPLYSIFAYRPTPEGKTEGLNIYVTERRGGPLGALISRLALHLTRKILTRGGGEDRVIQNSIRFNPSPYAFDNKPFRAFVDYVERQPLSTFARSKSP